jgi:hypothetical protein
MKLRTETQVVNVTRTQGGETKTYPDQEKVTLSSPFDFLAEVSEISSKCTQKIIIGYGGEVYFYTHDGKKIVVFLKSKYPDDGEFLEVGMDSQDKNYRLKGEWVKRKFCPNCDKELTAREEGYIDLEV